MTKTTTDRPSLPIGLERDLTAPASSVYLSLASSFSPLNLAGRSAPVPAQQHIPTNPEPDKTFIKLKNKQAAFARSIFKDKVT